MNKKQTEALIEHMYQKPLLYSGHHAKIDLDILEDFWTETIEETIGLYSQMVAMDYMPEFCFQTSEELEADK